MINHPNRKKAKLSISSASAVDTHDHDYSALLTLVRKAFADAVGSGVPLFETDADGLNDLYLKNLPAKLRQVHTCHCCRRFIGTYGNLVKVGENGELIPVMWNPEGAPKTYSLAFKVLQERVAKAKIIGVFHTKEAIWGNPVTGDWSHISVVPPASMVYRERALTAFQAMAAAKENYRTIATALTEFTKPMLDEAMRLFTAETLARSEKFVGPVRWLRALHDRPKGRAGANLMWLAIATAPEGYCHPRASVIGLLLEGIAAGKPFATIKRNFDAKLAPLAYQRPQAAPTAGNIKAAEALVEKLGIAPSLERRFATLDDVQEFLWQPTAAKPSKAEGVFGHLKPKNSDAVAPVNLPTVTMTWDKFARTVLLNAEQLDLLVPSAGRFIAMTTAANEEAPPILKWDRDDERNPVAWYVYSGQSSALQWGLSARSWTRVLAVTPFPNQWGSRPMPFIGEGVVLVLEGAVDSRDNSGNALFPECLKDELHGARSTIEAYSRNARIAGRNAGQLASGYDIRKVNNNSADCTVRVLAGGAWTSYHVDRWD